MTRQQTKSRDFRQNYLCDFQLRTDKSPLEWEVRVPLPVTLPLLHLLVPRLPVWRVVGAADVGRGRLPARGQRLTKGQTRVLALLVLFRQVGLRANKWRSPWDRYFRYNYSTLGWRGALCLAITNFLHLEFVRRISLREKRIYLLTLFKGQQREMVFCTTVGLL